MFIIHHQMPPSLKWDTPHTSDRTQPTDLSFFDTFKNGIAHGCMLHLTQGGAKRITKNDIAELIGKVFVKAATMDKGIGGFHGTGIYALNPDKFTPEDFAVANPIEYLESIGLTLATKTCSIPDESTSNDISGNLSTPIEEGKSLESTPLPSTSAKSGTYNRASDRIQEVSQVKIAPLESKNTTNSRRQHSEIFTASPNEEKLREKMNKKKAKTVRQSTSN